MRIGPFILVTDNDGHHYVIPEAKLIRWEVWCNIPSDDERSWEPPDFAEAVGGSPSLVSFPSYTIK